MRALVVSAALMAACAPAPAANPNAPPGGYHIVRAGDTYDSIAAQHRVETAALLDLNRLHADAPLNPGQPLAVPAATLPPLAQPAPGTGAPQAAQNPIAANPAAPGPATANPEPAAPAAASPEDTLELRPAPPTPFSPEWRDEQLARIDNLIDQAWSLYTQVRESPGGIFIIAGVAIVAGFFALQILLWLGRELVLALIPLARRLGSAGHELVLNIWYAAWWAGLAFYVPARAAWKFVQPWAEPRARALGRFALDRGTTWSRRGAAWAAAASRRAAVAVRDEAIDALAELALSRPSLRGVSDKLQQLAYNRDSHAMRARVPGSMIGAWPPPEEQLLDALASGALTVQFAPMLDVTAVTVAALDSSLRWERADGTTVSEARLATAIERPGYTRIQRAVLAHALAEACARAASPEGTESPAVIAVNLGRAQFADPTLFSSLRSALERSGAAAGQLEVAVDERAVLADLVAAGEILGRLAELGVRTTVRDFGALTAEQLRALGVNGVTIDFWNSRRDERVSRYVADSVRTAHQLGLPVTASRAETPEEVDFARSLHCERLASSPAAGTGSASLIEFPPADLVHDDSESLAAAA